MAKKGAKATKKFAKSGELKRAIDARRKHQKVKKQIQARKSKRGAPITHQDDDGGSDAGDGDEPQYRKSKGKGKGKGKEKAIDFIDGDDGDEGSEEGESANRGQFSGMSVDQLLNGDFMNGDDDEEDGEDGDDDDDDFSSIDDLENEEEAHRLELSALAEKDPEFYKYLQENDKELLNFTAPTAQDDADSEDGGFAMGGDDEDMESGDEGEEVPVLTSQILRGWQKAILETRSLRAFRKLLVAFRSAARMNEDSDEKSPKLAWKIEDSSVFNKLVVTTLKYTPVVLEHHVPYKSLPNGKFKSPAQNSKFKALQKLILSYFLSLVHFVSQLSDADMQRLALTESARVIPYIVSGRKAVREYLKMCLDLWSSAEDEVRISAFLSMRKLASAQDESIVDLVLKGTYMTLVRSCKSTTAHSLPSITLMKNSASELYCMDHVTAYQHAFGYVRQLAVHLRNSMKVKSKEAYRQVYNWQFAHSVDFWALVLAKACDVEAEAERGSESELKPLIYPLIQIALGAIRLIPTSRYHPFHLQLIRSLLHLVKRTRTYLNLTPLLLPIITSTVTPSSRPKPSTLRPLDLLLHIRAPAQYLKTRVYAESVCEEALFLLGSWCESVQNSVAFPEIVLPLVITLRKSVKKSSGGKPVSMVKTLVERVEEGGKWVSLKRDKVTFAPGMSNEVERWENGINIEETPLGKWMRVQRKSREKKQALVDKAREGEEHMLEDD